MSTPVQLTAAECAKRAGITARSWRSYAWKGEAPPPNGLFGRTPWWSEGRLSAWLNYGPGRTGVNWAAWVAENPGV